MLDLTEGRPFRALLIFALPVIGGNLFQLFTRWLILSLWDGRWAPTRWLP